VLIELSTYITDLIILDNVSAQPFWKIMLTDMMT
jgi:hypothetical protein